MTGSFWLDLLIGAGTALVLAWVVLVVVMLVLARPRGALLSEALRLLPDLLRLLRRLAADPGLPRGVRIRLGALLVYLAVPIGLIPDFIPVLGYADDAIIVMAVLRSVARRAGTDAVRPLARHRRRLHRPGPAHRPARHHTVLNPPGAAATSSRSSPRLHMLESGEQLVLAADLP